MRGADNGSAFIASGAAAERSQPRRDRLLSLAVPFLLVAVAVTQLVFASTGNLTPWRGGGFGMFSTLDSHDTRFLRISATTADGQPVHFDSQSLRVAADTIRETSAVARAHPTPRNLAALAHLIEGDALVSGQIAAVMPDEDRSPASDANRQRIVVQSLVVWRLSFDRSTNTVRPERVTHQYRAGE